MSRPRKPAELRALEGNPGKRPLPPRAPKGPGFPKRVPRTLEGEARVMWARVVPALSRLGYLRAEHVFAVEYLCRCWADYVAGDRGAGREFRLMLSQLGLTPASWASIAAQVDAGSDGQPGGDGLGRFLGRQAS